MKAIIQRVTKASVSVGDETISSIGRGLCILLGISRNDTAKDAEFMIRKILNLRLFDGEDGKRWCKSVKDSNLEILCVSQFTLQCILKGNKPDFHEAMAGDQSKIMYDQFLEDMKKNYDASKIKNGVFGAHMVVSIDNDGPVTIEVNSPPPKQSKKVKAAPAPADKAAEVVEKEEA